MSALAGLPAPAVTEAQFRADYPQFADTTIYPSNQVVYWLTVATVMTSGSAANGNMLWGTLLPIGIELFTAHFVTLMGMQLKTAQVGGIPGLSKGPISSESPGAVSVSYDTNAAMEENAGHWNETQFGRQFIRLAKMVGAGAVQIGGATFGAGSANGAGAWIGPPPWPGFFG